MNQFCGSDDFLTEQLAAAGGQEVEYKHGVSSTHHCAFMCSFTQRTWLHTVMYHAIRDSWLKAEVSSDHILCTTCMRRPESADSNSMHLEQDSRAISVLTTAAWHCGAKAQSSVHMILTLSM